MLISVDSLRKTYFVKGLCQGEVSVCGFGGHVLNSLVGALATVSVSLVRRRDALFVCVQHFFVIARRLLKYTSSVSQDLNLLSPNTMLWLA